MPVRPHGHRRRYRVRRLPTPDGGDGPDRCGKSPQRPGNPEILEAAVIGVHDPLRDEAVKAFVVRTPGSSLDTGGVLAHCRGLLAYFKVPTIVVFPDDLPHVHRQDRQGGTA